MAGIKVKALVAGLAASGVLAAVVAFSLERVSELRAFDRQPDEQNVRAIARVIENDIEVYVRNESDYAIDLRKIEVEVTFDATEELGSYQDISHVYSPMAQISPGLSLDERKLSFSALISQVVLSEQRDRFVFRVDGLERKVPLNLTATLYDLDGRVYSIRNELGRPTE